MTALHGVLLLTLKFRNHCSSPDVIILSGDLYHLSLKETVLGIST